MKGEGWKEEQAVCKQANVQGVEWKANKQRDKARDLNPGCYKSEQTWLECHQKRGSELDQSKQ